jgi:steroid delta-isomerase-like uncharacterized protein
MSVAQHKELVRSYFEDFCTGRRLDLAEHLFSQDYALHDPQIPNIVGPAAMAQVIAAYQTGVEGHWQIEELLATEDDRVLARWTGTGRHTGDVMGIPPTGNTVRVDALSLFRFADGKIAEQWEVWDTLGFLQQLGVMPSVG